MFRRFEDPRPDKPIPCGRYELLERIGFGGMAEVFLARLPGPAGFEKIVVVKRILPRLADDQLVTQMFVEEAKIAAAADHDNIAQVFELGQTEDGKYFMVMEYIAGIDLELLLKSAAHRSLKLPTWWSVHILCEVLEALGFVHDLTDEHGNPRNVIHRDATPSNIFVSNLGKAKLADFGVADYEGKSNTTLAGQLKGKLSYMSPEQLNNKALDQRSDLFSIGVVLWELLTQQRLFGLLNEMQAMMAICEGERKKPSELVSGIIPELDTCVLKALAADRDDRYDNAAAFQSDLLDVLHKMRPPVRRSEVREVVQVLLGRMEPTEDTVPPPAAAIEMARSFLEDVPKDRQAPEEEPPKEEEWPAGPGPNSRRGMLDEPSLPGDGPVIDYEDDPTKIDDTYVPDFAVAEVMKDVPQVATVPQQESSEEVATLDESDESAQVEIARLREMIAARKAQRQQSEAKKQAEPIIREPSLPMLDPAELVEEDEGTGDVDTGDVEGGADPTIPMSAISVPKNVPSPVVMKAEIDTPFIELEKAKIPKSITQANQLEENPLAKIREGHGAPPSPTSTSPAARILDPATPNALWVRRKEEKKSAAKSYEEALEYLTEAGLDGLPVCVSSDAERWMELEEFAQLTGQDLVMDMSAPPSNVTVVGSLNQRSLHAVFGILARDRSTGTLAVANAEGPDEWYEVHVAEGRPTNIVTNVTKMQLPNIFIADGMIKEEDLPELIHTVVKERRPLDQVVRGRTGKHLDRPTYMKKRLTELFKWRSADYTFNVDFTRTAGSEPFAGSLLSLLVPLTDTAYTLEELRKVMMPSVGRTFEPSWRYDEAIKELELPTEQLSLVESIKKGGKPLKHWLEIYNQQEKQLLTLVLVLKEADILLESLD